MSLHNCVYKWLVGEQIEGAHTIVLNHQVLISKEVVNTNILVQ